MRTRSTGKLSDSEDTHQKNIHRGYGAFFHGNKVTCPRLKATRAFYKIKDWVEVNEPEFFDAFTKKNDTKSKRRIRRK